MLTDDGWFFVRQRGSHRVFRHPTKTNIVVVPGNLGKDMAPGTLNAISRGGAEEMKYMIVIEKTRTGYSAYVPDVPGCVTVGSTRREIVKNMREALDLYFEETAKRGARAPRPTSTTAYVDVAPPRADRHPARRRIEVTGARVAATRYSQRRHSDSVDARRRP